MKVLLIGADGQLGTEIRKVFGEEVIPLTHAEIEITDPGGSRKVIEKQSPDAIINTAAYHNVPDCEKNPEMAFRVNAMGAKNLADICQAHSIPLVHLSTDYIFDGQKGSPYTEEDVPRPLNAYGISKLAGEFFVRTLEKHYTIRISSLFGVSGCRAKGGKNFVKTMLEFARTRDRIQVTANIVSSPTYARDAALKIKEILNGDYPPGIYHCANRGACSWYEFALEIFRQTGASIEVAARIETEELEGIKRPLYTALATNKTNPLRSWKEALKDYLKEENSSLKEA